jgi:hypothetical protein
MLFSSASPSSSSAGDDRLERIERSLLAFTDVVKALVDTIPRQAQSASPAAEDPSVSVSGSGSSLAGGKGQKESAAQASASTEPQEQPEPEEELGFAWERFLQSEGVEPGKKPRKRSSGAARIARQGRARATDAKDTPEPKSEMTQSPSAQAASIELSTGQGIPGELGDLARVRETVLDLAGSGMPTEQICHEVGLGPKEVGLILKSLFRANA